MPTLEPYVQRKKAMGDAASADDVDAVLTWRMPGGISPSASLPPPLSLSLPLPLTADGCFSPLPALCALHPGGGEGEEPSPFAAVPPPRDFNFAPADGDREDPDSYFTTLHQRQWRQPHPHSHPHSPPGAAAAAAGIHHLHHRGFQYPSPVSAAAAPRRRASQAIDGGVTGRMGDTVFDAPTLSAEASLQGRGGLEIPAGTLSPSTSPSPSPCLLRGVYTSDAGTRGAKRARYPPGVDDKGGEDYEEIEVGGGENSGGSSGGSSDVGGVREATTGADPLVRRSAGTGQVVYGVAAGTDDVAAGEEEDEEWALHQEGAWRDQQACGDHMDGGWWRGGHSGNGGRVQNPTEF